jgi:hypothetical protein
MTVSLCDRRIGPVLAFLVLIYMATAVGFAQTIQTNPLAHRPDPNASSMSIKPYFPITRRQRLRWLVSSTLGPETLTVGLFSAGFGTARDTPPEYGSSWAGFAKNYGMRLTGVATGNTMEAGIGALWSEDPRYFPAYRQARKGRIKNVVWMTFLAHNREGQLMPAYARYVAAAGNNFLSNTWRPDSEANTKDAIARTLWGFVGLMAKNSFTEFWPDFRRHIFHLGGPTHS